MYFDEDTLVRAAKIYRSLQGEVATDGKAVVVTAGPPGAGKTSALDTLNLKGFRRIDPDVVKDILLDDAERHGLLKYRHDHTLPDGRPVGVRELGSQVHQFSTYTADIIRSMSLTAGENVVIEGTLSWPQLADVYITDLFNANYEGVEVIDVEAPFDVALERIRERWWSDRIKEPMGGRFVSDDVLKGYYADGLGESVCAHNAAILAERAADELGHGILRRFDVETDGSVKQTSRTDFGSMS
ncbi:hypothetical protein AHiyo8_pI69300 (plasmid) [Arthrobacter sp. Hiyo8]|nr:hypothetical protein AHiyo8_pI69300 [Arthrobacter sp. Hiyo8]